VIWLSFIGDKTFKPEAAAEMTLKDEKVLQELLDGVLSKKDEVRYGSFKALNILSEKHPEKLYGKWDFFADLLRSDNTHHKYIAFDAYFEKSKDQARIIEFVKAQLNCESPKTRDKAKAFLKKRNRE
jgi:hypothetical protein